MTQLARATTALSRVLHELPEIRYVGDPLLRAPCHDANPHSIKELSDRMISLLMKYREITGSGRGLAAPQIGASERVFVTYVDDSPTTYINPQITYSSQELCLYRELCMSCGIVSADVRRSRSITLQYTDLEGIRRSSNYDGFMARLIQHEVDHLDGKLCIDIAEPGSIALADFDPLAERLRSIT